MSRVAKMPIVVPAGAEVAISAQAITVKGPLGTLTQSLNGLVKVENNNGTLTFDVKNDGSQVTEFYLLGEDGLRIVGEVENIGPQLSRELVVNAPAGSYVTACKPGMKGDGIRADFTVSEKDRRAIDALIRNDANFSVQHEKHESSGNGS